MARRRNWNPDPIMALRARRNLTRSGLIRNIIETNDFDKLKHCLEVFDAETEKLVDELLQRIK
jgi:hypothetical protein